MESKKVIAGIINLYRYHGGAHYMDMGEVTLLEHALQTAALAAAEDRDDEFIVAAFLHDIGHLLAREDGDSQDDIDALTHDRLGADYLLRIGFSARVSSLVASHTQAKRYLCAIEPGHYDQMSAASKETLHWQGGVMKMDEVVEFSSRKDLEDVIALRCFDEAARDKQQITYELSEMEALLVQVFEQQAALA